MLTLAGAAAILTKRSTWITIVVVLGVLLAGFAIMSYVSTKNENTMLNRELTVTKAEVAKWEANARANAKAVESRNVLIQALAETETIERVKTVKALEANPNWANQPIPPAILDSLRD